MAEKCVYRIDILYVERIYHKPRLQADLEISWLHRWRKKKEELREHGDTWPDDDDEYVVLHHTWWVAMAQTKVEHFTSLCGGDKGMFTSGSPALWLIR
jgi:hypothetical protein